MTVAPDLTDRVEGRTYTAQPVHEVVAVVLEHHNRIALFRRSHLVRHDRGLWHCITGYLEAGSSPRQQALTELYEEAGVAPEELCEFEHCASFDLADHRGDPWLVHTFKAVTTRRRLLINEEHDSYRWTAPAKVSRFSNRVEWLSCVLDTVLQPHQARNSPPARTSQAEERKPHGHCSSRPS